MAKVGFEPQILISPLPSAEIIGTHCQAAPAPRPAPHFISFYIFSGERSLPEASSLGTRLSFCCGPFSCHGDEHPEDISYFHTGLTIQTSSWVVQMAIGVSPHHRGPLGVLKLRSILTSLEYGIRLPWLRVQCQKTAPNFSANPKPVLPTCWLHLLFWVPVIGFN